MLQQPRELVERRDAAGRVFQYFGLHRVHAAQRLPGAHLPMQLLQREQWLPRCVGSIGEHVFPRLDRLAVLVLSFQHLRLASEQGDALCGFLGKLQLALEIGKQVGPVVLLGAHARQRVDGGPGTPGLPRPRPRTTSAPWFDPRGALHTPAQAGRQLAHASERRPSCGAEAPRRLTSSSQAPRSRQLPRQLLKGGRMPRVDLDRLRGDSAAHLRHFRGGHARSRPSFAVGPPAGSCRMSAVAPGRRRRAGRSSAQPRSTNAQGSKSVGT